MEQILESIKKLAGITPGVNFEKGMEIGIGVEHFSIEMTARMIQKMREGYVGWNDPDSDDDVEKRMAAKMMLVLSGNATDKDLVDIANFAMILWTRNGYSK